MLELIQNQAAQSLESIQECEATLKKLESNYKNALNEIRDDKKLIALAKLHAEIHSAITNADIQLENMKALATQAARDAKTASDSARHCEQILDALSKKFIDIEFKGRN